MPGVTLELISCTPQERINQEIKGIAVPFNKKSDDNTDFIDLFCYIDGEIKSYWVLAFQDAKQREEDLKRTRERLAIEKNNIKDVFFACWFVVLQIHRNDDYMINN